MSAIVFEYIGNLRNRLLTDFQKQQQELSQNYFNVYLEIYLTDNK